MKKRTMSQAKDFPSCALYLSDLDDILEIMSGINSISDQAFEYENLDELKSKRGSNPRELFIENAPLGLALRIWGAKTQLGRGGNPSAIASFAQIQDILNRNRRKILYLFFSRYSAIVAALLFLVLFFLDLPRWESFISVVLLFSWVIVSFRNQTGGFTRIYLLNRHEQQSFLKSNKDAIIVGIISALISSALSFLVAYLLFRGGIK
jgi:hypothetical protein